MKMQDLQEYISKMGLNFSLEYGQISVVIDDVGFLLSFLGRLKDECGFLSLMSLCGADYPTRFKRFEVVYNLLSYKNNLRLRVKVPVEEGKKVPSVSSLFRSAIWLERETFDMYGIEFENAPDGRRILTDYGFEGYPLRKDFPVTGFKEIRYDFDKGQILETDIQLNQEFRLFDFEMPWQGTQYVIQKQDDKK